MKELTKKGKNHILGVAKAGQSKQKQVIWKILKSRKQSKTENIINWNNSGKKDI